MSTSFYQKTVTPGGSATSPSATSFTPGLELGKNSPTWLDDVTQSELGTIFELYII